MARRYSGRTPARRRTRRNPHFRGNDIGPLIAVGAAVGLTASGVLGATAQAAVRQAWNEVTAPFRKPGAGASSGASASGSSSVITSIASGNLQGLAALARANGVTDPNNPAAIPYGRTVWAWQHGGDASGYDKASEAEQANWNSYAIHGK